MNLYQKWCLKKATIKRNRILPFYQKDKTILDIGCGNCALIYLLKKVNYEVTCIDVKNKSVFKNIQPILYDGYELPFEENSFDIVQIITVLHHTKHPEKIINEAKRVGKKVLIMEDIYTNVLQKKVTFFIDSLNNWEFLSHPHTNKTDAQWKNIFRSQQLAILKAEYYRFLLIFKQVTYFLSK